jgi:triphosphoribosyl-dephospho-CoA synthetase
VEGIERRVRRAIALAIMLEPTGWGISGNVSRTRDHPDKTIQDYIVLGYEMGSKVVEVVKRERGDGSGFLILVEDMMRMFQTNLAFGEIFLLYLNAFGAMNEKSLDIDTVAEGGAKLLFSMKLENYMKALRASSPSFIGRFSSSLIPSLTPPLSRNRIDGRVMNFLRLNPFDPVSLEASRGFPFSRSNSKRLLSNLSCRIPNSEDIDFVFRRACCTHIDFLVYRKRGIEAAEQASKECCFEKTEESIGSISDLVALTLFYYFLNCSGGS